MVHTILDGVCNWIFSLFPTEASYARAPYFFCFLCTPSTLPIPWIMPGSRRFPVSTRTLGTCELVNLGRGLRIFSLQGIRRLSPAFPGTCHHYQTIVFPELSVAKFLTRISQPPKRTLVFNSAFSRRSIYLEFSDDVRACLSSDGPRRTTTFLQVARQQMDIPSCAVVVNPRGRWHWVKGKTAPRSAHTAQVIR